MHTARRATPIRHRAVTVSNGREPSVLTPRARFRKLLNCGDTDANARSSLIGEAVAAGAIR